MAGLHRRSGVVECFYCGGKMSARHATVEHIVPVAAGGLTEPNNCVPAHRNCNEAAGTLSADDKAAFRLVLLEEMRLAGMHQGQPVTFRVLLRAAQRCGLKWNRNRSYL